MRRIWEWVKEKPSRWLLTAAGLLAAGLLILNSGIDVYRYTNGHLDWRDREYMRLQQLRAGFSREQFRAELGTPVFDRRGKSGRFREETYQRREHWVQTISNRGGTVELYAVTSCSSEFRPKFQIDDRSVVELQQSSGASVEATGYDYFPSGATANSRFHDVRYGANPGNYKTYVWGLNDVCPDWFAQFDQFYKQKLLSGTDRPFKLNDFSMTPDIDSVGETRIPDWVTRFDKAMTVNTYAETSPHFSLWQLRGSRFQVGADRILTRTTL